MTDDELEQAIDKAGRSACFDVAWQNGWTAQNPPPKYIWWQIVAQVMPSRKEKP